MFFAKFGIKVKLGMVFGFLLLMIVIMSCLGLSSTRQVNMAVERMAKVNYAKTVAALEASKVLEEIQADIRMAVLLRDRDDVAKIKQRIDSSRTKYKEAMLTLAQLEKSEKGVQLLNNIESAITPAVAANNLVIELVDGDRRDEATALLMKDGVPLTQKVQRLFDEQVQFQRESVDAEYGRSVALYTRVKLIQFAAGALSIILGLAASIFLINNFVTRINRVADAMNRVADGDLSTQLKIYAKDEIGELGRNINRMLTSISAMITAIKNTANQVASASNSLYANSEQIATGNEQVAAQVGTVATSSEEMAATSSEIANNCTTAAESSRQASDLATEGVSVVHETVAGMNRIAERVKKTAATVENLGVRSDQIGEIVGTIEDIADQTNLLALNAAIEAARAGEQGRGFAVVADEVRALAERTSRATKEIGQMIKAIQTDTKGAVAAIDEGVQEVERGTNDAARSGKALENIFNQISDVTVQINQIATAAEQQSATSMDISRNIQQITDVIQASAAFSHNSVTSARELSTCADGLQHLVDQFTLAADTSRL
ncbi:MAG: methyl-accepting chemotaxis protein [Desulfuromonadaceae bacterium]|nr:methyl-accepting chemotaxis protein [Desulfuromonadaceae bacterium]